MSSVPETTEPGRAPPRIGSYQLLQSLGTGGMSSVFHAVHVESGHEVAVKVLPRSLAKNPTLLQRFLREAKSAEALEHPNIAAIYDRGSDQGRHYLVLEYVEGGDLQDRVKSDGPLPIGQAVRVVRAVAEGLRYASGRGVIHRDIKPANLLVTPAGEVKIIDLGLALQADDEDERVTRDGTTVGTVDYMSPEQARDSRATSERSDMYSLGCTFYYLLTGKPPFAGGNVPDKLGRHCTAPIPDVRELRPDASEPLTRLIQKMMAKKPEARFSTYDALINAIESVPEAKEEEPGETLEALIADDDDSDDAILLTPSEPSDSRVPPKSSPSPRSPQPTSKRPEPVQHEVSLADLAELDDDKPTASSLRKPHKSTVAQALIDDSEEHPIEAASSGGSVRSVPGRDIPLSTWIAAGAILGLSIALLGFGVLSLLAPAEAPALVVDEGTRPGESVANTPDESPPDGRPIPSTPLKNSNGPIIILPKAKAKAPVVAAVPWVEPADPVDVVSAERVYPPAVEAVSLPEWARSPVPAAVAGPATLVKRFVDPTQDSEVATLRQALDRPQPLIEIADNGPFLEEDFRNAAKTRTIRARTGYRPMIVVRHDLASTPIPNRSSLLVLDGLKLTLEGIDLVVDTAFVPNTLATIFQLKGGELTLKNCSVTVLGASSRPLTLVKVDEPTDDRPNRGSQVRFEQCNIRSTSKTIVDINGPCDFVANRSLLLSGSGEVISVRSALTRGERDLFFYRSLIVARGSAVEVAGGKGIAPSIISLGSTFAKVVGVSASGLVRIKTDTPGGTPEQVVEWRGHDDAFLGWPAFVTQGERDTSVVANLAAASKTWKSADSASHLSNSRESKTGWPSNVLDDLRASALTGLAEARPEVVARLAWPNPTLLEATVRSYVAPELPAMPQRAATTGARPSPFPTVSFIMPKSGKAALKAGVSHETKDGELLFHLEDAEFQGDLGLFLARKVVAGKKTRIKVIGNAASPRFTPVQLPDGASVNVEMATEPGREPTWVAASGARSPALISLAKGDLSLKGIFLVGTTSAALPHFIRVEDGHLLLTHCSFRGSDASAGAASGLIMFRSTGTKPLESGTGPFLSRVDRPILHIVDSSLVVSGGEAITAELGRGIVSLKNVAILSDGEGGAIELRPQKVARDRFDANLLLDHCSIAAERNFVTVVGWPGKDPGPDRPWLISSRNTVFLELVDRGKHQAVLLRSKNGALAHGAAFWQASHDAYDIAFFTAWGDALPTARQTKPDVRAFWINLWGSNHVLTNVIGPSPRKTDPVLTLLARDRPKPGGGSVEALKLDEKVHAGLGADFKSLPTKPLSTGGLLKY